MTNLHTRATVWTNAVPEVGSAAQRKATAAAFGVNCAMHGRIGKVFSPLPAPIKRPKPRLFRERGPRWPARPCIAGLALFLLTSVSAETAQAADKGLQPVIASSASSSTPLIVVGFVGGFVRHDDLRHSEVQLAQKLRAAHRDHFRIVIFGNRQRKAAHRTILRWLDTDEDGELSDEEKRCARIVLFGHSWGGAAVISLARQLQREGIPVLLTVQVDSIAKPGQDDRVVPSNVARAVSFYQTRGLLHGPYRITAADPAHTDILGNFLFDYQKMPVECSRYPWLTRHLFPGHTAIECDPQVWSQIEGLIGRYGFAQPAASEARLR